MEAGSGTGVPPPAPPLSVPVPVPVESSVRKELAVRADRLLPVIASSGIKTKLSLVGKPGQSEGHA